ncbi:MAG: hypothetical protein JSV81_00175 [Anaerolineales bacterium]|nr:MAG: hypothetical protein JSV81_00175 [Anaerolineales bacterium]
MSYEVHAEVVEGNDVWFAHRVELPTGAQLLNSHVVDAANALVITLYRETVVGNRRREVTVVDVDGSAVPPAAIVEDYLSDAYEFDYWGGKDDRGHNFVYQLPYTGADYTLEGGNTYTVEFAIKTTDYGTLRWANRLHVSALNAL